MHTLTLSKVEADMVEKHLTLARDRLMPSHPDRACIDGVLVKLHTDRHAMVLGRLEVFCILRALRGQRHMIRIDMEALEERRMRGGHNGHNDAAWHVLDAEAVIIDDVRRRLWDMI
jgi:hypothetical protein